jgi:hypothetical protein
MDAFEAQDLDPERRRPSLVRGWEAYRCLVRRAGIRINTRTSLSTTAAHQQTIISPLSRADTVIFLYQKNIYQRITLVGGRRNTVRSSYAGVIRLEYQDIGCSPSKCHTRITGTPTISSNQIKYTSTDHQDRAMHSPKSSTFAHCRQSWTPPRLSFCAGTLGMIRFSGFISARKTLSPSSPSCDFRPGQR